MLLRHYISTLFLLILSVSITPLMATKTLEGPLDVQMETKLTEAIKKLPQLQSDGHLTQESLENLYDHAAQEMTAFEFLIGSFDPLPIAIAVTIGLAFGALELYYFLTYVEAGAPARIIPH